MGRRMKSTNIPLARKTLKVPITIMKGATAPFSVTYNSYITPKKNRKKGHRTLEAIVSNASILQKEKK